MKISELPLEVMKAAMRYQREEKDTDYDKATQNLRDAFNWFSATEGSYYWNEWYNKEAPKPESLIHSFANEIKEEYPEIKSPIHYDNSKGSLYQFCEDQKLNTYEFDIIKRIMRCRKKGNFIEDLEKIKLLIDLYIKENDASGRKTD
jgi:hypothetical protein